MISLPGYQGFSKIHEGIQSVIYSAQRETDKLSVIVKVLKNDYPTPQELTKFRHEFEITQILKNLPGVVRVYELAKCQNTLAMILEHVPGQSLRSFIDAGSCSLSDFLSLAVRLVYVLGEIHSLEVIHKDINPSNILLTTDGRDPKFIDFGIATLLRRENLIMGNPMILEGTLAYISPEQTGRMNRSIDYRSDYYSLGVTLYELLCRRLPFASKDPLELVHSHIAKHPVPPHEIDPKIPKPVSNIVMKLMSKTAEERYQTVFGVKSDLEECLQQLVAGRKIVEFSVGQKDTSDRLQIPQKLYGREKDVQELMESFEHVCQGKCELMMVSGYSGIGKTSLVQEIHVPVTSRNSYYISGKFDQLQRGTPYVALIEAFRKLVSQILQEREEQIEHWKKSLLSALGQNAQLIINMIPELELIIGPQPEIVVVEGEEALARFHLVFQNFIKVFATAEHPFVIFLDDMQYADAASLKLIHHLVTGSDIRYFLLIGAYRDNEVNDAHPLMWMLKEVGQAGILINRIQLRPLEFVEVSSLMSETLRCSSETISPLARLVADKTHGNPFFVIEFLKSLVHDKLVSFDYEKGSWRWNLSEIQAKSITDNVVEMLAEKIKQLQKPTQQILTLAACMGGQFDLESLATIYERSPSETAITLREPLLEGLIFPLGKAYQLVGLDEPDLINQIKAEYGFAHDRIRQAAYSLMPEKNRNAVHWRVGRLLLQNTKVDELEKKVFDIVNHLNYGIDQIKSEPEVAQLIELNLLAGKKAKTSVAFQVAHHYFETGIRLLNPKSWQENYLVCLKLHEEAAESACFSGYFEQMEKSVSAVLEHAKSNLDKVKAYEVRIQWYTAKNKPIEAVKAGLEALKLLGMKLPFRPSKFDLINALVRIKIRLLGKRIEELADLPELKDPHKLAVLRLLSLTAAPAYLTAPELFGLLVMKTVWLSLKYGNNDQVGLFYAGFGIILAGNLGDLDSGYRFAKLGSTLMDRAIGFGRRSRTLFIFNGFVRHCKEPVRKSIQSFLEIYKESLDTGDFYYAAAAAHFYCFYSFHAGRDMEKLISEFRSFCESIEKIKQETFLVGNQLVLQLLLNLVMKTDDPCKLIGEVYNEDERLSVYEREKDENALFSIYLSHLILGYMYGYNELAVRNADLAQKYVSGGGTSLITVPIFYFFDSLARIAWYPSAQKSRQRQLLRRVAKNQKKLKKWADCAPENFRHKYLLVEAERLRLVGRPEKAIGLYDQAGSLARQNEFVNDEAIANELAARFHWSQGRERVAQTLMTEARYCYLRWGALAKVADLESKEQQILSRNILPSGEKIFQMQAKIAPTSSATVTISSPGESLDLESVVKASQSISGEIDLQRLQDKLMETVIQNAGAETGFLILRQEKSLRVVAGHFIERGDGKKFKSILVNDCDRLSPAIVNYVFRTKRIVVLNNAGEEGAYTQDEYVKKNKPKSVLCMPIIRHNEMIGVLYLENNKATHAFTPERIRVLDVLAAQAAISIDNAMMVSELKKLSESLTRSNEDLANALVQAQEASRIKGEFLANVSHELRTPLNAIINVPQGLIENFAFHEQAHCQKCNSWFELESDEVVGPETTCPQCEQRGTLKKENRGEYVGDPAETVHFLERIYNSGKHLLGVVNDILDISKLESGNVKINMEPVKVGEVLIEVLDLMHPLADELGIKLSFAQVAPEEGLISNRVKLRQILINLVNNAVKFSKPGSEVRVDFTTDETNVLFVVRDQGIGIAEENHELIFESFRQIDGGDTRKYGGVGLGLAITKNLVELFGGKIWIDSKLGAGSNFYVRLPRQAKGSDRINTAGNS